MRPSSASGLAGLALAVFLGLAALGYLLGEAAVQVKEYERSVTAKGLSEREFPADVVIWPASFTVAGNDLGEVYDELDASSRRVRAFLEGAGVDAGEITFSRPSLVDKSAQAWGDAGQAPFRYVATRSVTVYSGRVEQVRAAMSGLLELGKEGIAFTGDAYQNPVEYLFTRLNEVKPEMIEEATRNAREVAQKFAEDSQSRLGKIRRASQGQFSIEPRDTNNPHVKKVRVVSTVEYYLAD
ncbi:MAG: SIMPL domain-containing protein [Gammaproteobacteria bacterium]